MSAAVNSMIGAQLGSIGMGAKDSESGKESGTLESQASQRTRLVFVSIAVEIAASRRRPRVRPRLARSAPS